VDSTQGCEKIKGEGDPRDSKKGVQDRCTDVSGLGASDQREEQRPLHHAKNNDLCKQMNIVQEQLDK